MNILKKPLTLAAALLLTSTSVYAGPGTLEAFDRLKQSMQSHSRSLDATERLPVASQRYEMNRRLAWSEARKATAADTEIAVFETSEPEHRPVKR